MENRKLIRLSKSIIGDEEIKSVTDVLRKEYLGMGQDVKFFEELLSGYFKREAVCVNTGTAALHLACQAIGLKKGDEVLIQSLTFVATFQAISACGAKPVACEVTENINIDLKDAERKLTKNTRAIVPVHYASSPGDLNAIYEFARKHKLRVIEDAAHAFGTIYNGKLIGSFGDIVCFSFDGIKNITSGEGGAIVTSDTSVLGKVKDYRLLSVMKDTEKRFSGQRSWDFDVAEQGWRFHMSNIMAAIGIEQFKKFPHFKEKRQAYAKLYQSLLSNVKGITILDLNYDEVVPHIFIIRVDATKRDYIREELKNKYNIETGIHYKPNHLLSYYRNNMVSLALTERIYSGMLTLPLHPDLEEEDIVDICKILKSLL
jgi:dTDP-4-amino-4,6-dideoxygalactose transaminase